jgi:hypothetical protein
MAIVCGKCGSKRIEEDYVPGIGNAGLICRHCGQTGREGWVTDRKLGGADMAKDQPKPQDGAKKICKKCEERETLSKSCPYCAKCMGDIARDKKQAKKTPETKDSKGTRERPDLPGKARPGAITAVTIDFENYGGLLVSIHELANEEVRPVDLQIIYLLKSKISDMKKAAGAV